MRLNALMSLLDEIDPQIINTVGVGILNRDPDSTPQGWHPSYQAQPSKEALTGSSWNFNEILNYLARSEAMGERANQLVQERGETPANKAAAMNVKAGLANVRNSYQNKTTGRPGVSVVLFLPNIARGPEWKLKIADRVYDHDTELNREIIRAYMTGLEEDLSSMHRLLFEMPRSNGEASLGWTSQNEKTRFMVGLNGLRSEDHKTKIQKLWQAQKGDSTLFEQLWTNWERTLRKWAEAFEAKDASAEFKAVGEEASEVFLGQWGIQNSIDELLEYALSDLEDLRNTMEALRPQRAPEAERKPEITSDKKVLSVLKAQLRIFQRELVESGLLPRTSQAFDATALDHTFRSRTDQSPQIASCSPAGLLTLKPYTGFEAFWQQYGERFTAIVRHEVTHGWQFKATDPRFRSGMSGFAQEAGAIAQEHLHFIQLENPRANTAHQTLLAEAKRAAHFYLGLGVHSGRITDRTEINRLLTSLETSPEDVSRVVSGYEAGWEEMGMYWVAGKLFQAHTELNHRGDVVAGFRSYAHETQLTLPPHFLIRNQDPTRFTLPESSSQVARMARERFQL